MTIFLPTRQRGKRFISTFRSTGTNAPLSTMTACHLEELPMLYEQDFWPASTARIDPNTSHIISTTVPYITANSWNDCIVDIEVWGSTTASKYVTVMNCLRGALPNNRWGIYGTAPARSYWAFNGDSAEATSYAAQNRDLQIVAEMFDYVCPSAYTFYDLSTDMAGWQAYVLGNINAAKAYNKPVYPTLWPQYHDSAASGTAWVFIPGSYVAVQMQYCADNADGFVFWGNLSSGTGAIEPWTTSIARGNWWANVQSKMAVF